MGVGPGDPELVTVKAVRVLREADLVFVPVLADRVAPTATAARRRRVRTPGGPRRQSAPTSRRTGCAGCRSRSTTAAGSPRGGQPPGTPPPGRWSSAFAAGARSVAFATIGDPNVYSTFSYLAQTVRALRPEVRVATVPGITAMQELAARSGILLCEGPSR